MQFEREDRQKLAKIGVKNVLDLALLIPKKFEDLSIKLSVRVLIVARVFLLLMRFV